MCNFYLNHIKQLDHPATRALSELNNGGVGLLNPAGGIATAAASHMDTFSRVDEAEILSLKLENLEKLVNLLDTDLRPLNGKLLKDLTVNKDELILLKEHTRQGLNEILILLKELEFELLTKKPINNNCPNPYEISNKKIRLLLINTLHELYRNTLRLEFYLFKDLTVASHRADPPFICKEPREVALPAYAGYGDRGGERHPTPQLQTKAPKKSGPFKPLKKIIPGDSDVVLTQTLKEGVAGAPIARASHRSQLLLKVNPTPSATLMSNYKGVGAPGQASHPQEYLKGAESLSGAPSSQVLSKINQPHPAVAYAHQAAGLSGPVLTGQDRGLFFIKSKLNSLDGVFNKQNQNYNPNYNPWAGVARGGLATPHAGRDLPTIVSLNLYKFKFLIYFLEKLFNKPIELNLIRLKYPYHESNILAQVLALSSKKYKFFLIMRKLFYTASIKHPGKSAGLVQKGFNGFETDMFKIIPSYLSGLKVRLAGRLLTEKLVPRKTVKTFQVGSLSRGKVNFKTTSRITLKNKRGAYSFTVTTSHILANSTRPS